MPTIADIMGFALLGDGEADIYTLSSHAKAQITQKGFEVSAVMDAANNPTHTSPNGRYPGQWRHVRGTICAVVDRETRLVVTCYVDATETEVRPDQKDRDALAYAASRVCGI